MVIILKTYKVTKNFQEISGNFQPKISELTTIVKIVL